MLHKTMLLCTTGSISLLIVGLAIMIQPQIMVQADVVPNVYAMFLQPRLQHEQQEEWATTGTAQSINSATPSKKWVSLGEAISVDWAILGSHIIDQVPTLRICCNDRREDDTERKIIPQDANEEDGPTSTSSTATTAATHHGSPSSNNDNYDGEKDQVVGVKYHHSGKKSNAIGDPDGEGSDSDDDDDEDRTDFDESDWDHFEEQLEGVVMDAGTPQLQVQLELVEESTETETGPATSSIRSPSGGVGLRLGQRLQNHRRHRNAQNRSRPTEIAQEEQLLEAWQDFVYMPIPLPETPQMRLIEGASKVRLDRRTLYAGLLLEWQKGTSDRKYLSMETSQALQAALSLASQPQWRRTLQKPNAIRMFANEPERGCTLAMQETIAMALAHSLNAASVIIDDQVISTIRQKLLQNGYPEDAAKPSVLVEALLSLAKNGKLQSKAKGLISKCMKRDIQLGLDDPFDERAISSCDEMADWEQSKDPLSCETKSMPLVIFVRAASSSLLFKSKSVVDVLMKECSSPDSTNLVIMGKGIDARTTALPKEPAAPDMTTSEHFPSEIPVRSSPGAAPWFGFSPHNQNASGQNDPEGSRRFNIFLARTFDAQTGTPGILGAIAPPQAGNLFPHMMAMQARERLAGEEMNDSPLRAELERWAQMLQQQMQTNGGMPLPPPQFFNASFPGNPSFEGEGSLPTTPPPQVIQEALQQAMSELLDRLAKMNDDEEDDEIDSASKLSPDLHKAFAQVLRNEHLRRGIAENLARAAPALSDPKCQGVMLSVYVPPPTAQSNRGKSPGTPMGGWFQKILNSQDDQSDRKSRQRRARTMAAAAAVMAANNAPENGENEKEEDKAERNLLKLESICRPIIVETPTDPVRAKSWNGWINRERGSVLFRKNRQTLNKQLEVHGLALQEHTGTRGAGSSLRQMLSVRDIGDEMENVIKCAIELEAARSQKMQESPEEMHMNESMLEIDITLSQLMWTEEGVIEKAPLKEREVRFVHPSSLETALTMICRISPSPSGGLSLSSASGSVVHRSREEIMALAQDKHERALVSQVVSPQDIGVTYDMIGGLAEVKELLRQSITYPLKYPHLYSEGIAREAVKGVLLFGPPGTGKTMLAKAVATEGGASFLSVDASSVENKWLGESEKNAKAVFTLARRLAPCVIFIDEVDSLLSSREGSSDDSAHGTLTSVKTTMMSEWDGLNSGTNGSGSDRVIVIGSTNRPFDLDEAVLRRFPRRILVDLPDLNTRREILEVTMAENRVDPAVNFTKIAERLEGYTGSDIKEVCREAVVQISHEQAKLLDRGHINAHGDVTQGSLQRLRPVTVNDFEQALSKLKRSVSEKGRELARVWEWNDEYGEVKKEKKNQLPQLANMYL